MPRIWIGIILLLIIPADVFSQERAVLSNGASLEVRVVSGVNKKGRKERVHAFVDKPVICPQSGKTVVTLNSPVAIKVRKIRRSGDPKQLEITFLSVKAVDGRKVRLKGNLFKPSMVINSRERRNNTIVNLAMAPFGYIAPVELERRLRMPDVVVTGDVVVWGEYDIVTE